MGLHIIPVFFVLNFNVKYKIGCDAGKLAGSDLHLGIFVHALARWLHGQQLPKVPGRWRRALKGSQWAPHWRARASDSEAETLCGKEWEEPFLELDTQPAPSSGPAASSPHSQFQPPPPQLPQHRALACASPRLSWALRPEPTGSSQGRRWTRGCPGTTACPFLLRLAWRC